MPCVEHAFLDNRHVDALDDFFFFFVSSGRHPSPPRSSLLRRASSPPPPRAARPPAPSPPPPPRPPPRAGLGGALCGVRPCAKTASVAEPRRRRASPPSVTSAWPMAKDTAERLALFAVEHMGEASERLREALALSARSGRRRARRTRRRRARRRGGLRPAGCRRDEPRERSRRARRSRRG